MSVCMCVCTCMRACVCLSVCLCVCVHSFWYTVTINKSKCVFKIVFITWVEPHVAINDTHCNKHEYNIQGQSISRTRLYMDNLFISTFYTDGFLNRSQFYWDGVFPDQIFTGMVSSQIRYLLGWCLPRSDIYWDGVFPDHTFTGMVSSQIRYLLGWCLPRSDIYWDGVFPDQIFNGMVSSQITHLLGWCLPRSDIYWDGVFPDQIFTGIISTLVNTMLTDVFMCLTSRRPGGSLILFSLWSPLCFSVLFCPSKQSIIVPEVNKKTIIQTLKHYHKNINKQQQIRPCVDSNKHIYKNVANN